MPLVSGSRWNLPARLARRLHADDMAFARDALADLEVLDVACRSAAISPEYSWPVIIGTGTVFLRPLVPFVDVDVGTADAGLVDFHQHILGTDGRDRAGPPSRCRARTWL